MDRLPRMPRGEMPYLINMSALYIFSSNCMYERILFLSNRVIVFCLLFQGIHHLSGISLLAYGARFSNISHENTETNTYTAEAAYYNYE